MLVQWLLSALRDVQGAGTVAFVSVSSHAGTVGFVSVSEMFAVLVRWLLSAFAMMMS